MMSLGPGHIAPTTLAVLLPLMRFTFGTLDPPFAFDEWKAYAFVLLAGNWCSTLPMTMILPRTTAIYRDKQARAALMTIMRYKVRYRIRPAAYNAQQRTVYVRWRRTG